MVLPEIFVLHYYLFPGNVSVVVDAEQSLLASDLPSTLHHRTLCREREKVALGRVQWGQSSPCCVVAIFIPESAISIKLGNLPIHAAAAAMRRSTFPIASISLFQARRFRLLF